MMGLLHPAKSFRHSITYCLLDKRLTLKLGGPGQLPYKDRAEVLYYNLCFGTKNQLIRQFNETRRLHPNMSRAVLHLSISFPPGEKLSKSTLVDLSLDCARFLGFDRHQFVTVLHKDTLQQHIHMVANRIGFDRHVVSDSYSYGRMADYCRQAELRYQLTKELGPRRYQSPQQRQTPRQGIRLTKLKETITQTLKTSADYPAFKMAMELNGYQVFKTERGIAFMDDKNVVIKGCEAGYPWKEIAARLSQQQNQRQVQQQSQRVRLRLNM